MAASEQLYDISSFMFQFDGSGDFTVYINSGAFFCVEYTTESRCAVKDDRSKARARCDNERMTARSMGFLVHTNQSKPTRRAPVLEVGGVHIDRARMQQALAQKSHVVPNGLSAEQIRLFILRAAASQEK